MAIGLAFDRAVREAMAAAEKGEPYEWSYKFDGKTITENTKTPKKGKDDEPISAAKLD